MRNTSPSLHFTAERRSRKAPNNSCSSDQSDVLVALRSKCFETNKVMLQRRNGMWVAQQFSTHTCFRLTNLSFTCLFRATGKPRLATERERGRDHHCVAAPVSHNTPRLRNCLMETCPSAPPSRLDSSTPRPRRQLGLGALLPHLPHVVSGDPLHVHHLLRHCVADLRQVAVPLPRPLLVPLHLRVEALHLDPPLVVQRLRLRGPVVPVQQTIHQISMACPLRGVP